MCEFKIINKADGSQIAEDILILSYTEDNELVLKDVLGMGEKLDSALILDVNTLNQECFVLQHPLIKDFIAIIRKINADSVNKSDIEDLFGSYDYEDYVINHFYLFFTEDVGSIEKLIVLLLLEDMFKSSVFSDIEIHRKLDAHGIRLDIGRSNRHIQNLTLRYMLKEEGRGKYRFALPIFPQLLMKREDVNELIEEVKEDAKKSL